MNFWNDLTAIEVIVILGAAAYLVYEFGNSDSVISQSLCSTLGVNCPGGAATQPTTGLGAVSTWLGSLWGTASVAVDNALSSTDNSVTQSQSLVGSYLADQMMGNPAPPAPATPGLPTGYNPTTGTVSQ